MDTAQNTKAYLMNAALEHAMIIRDLIDGEEDELGQLLRLIADCLESMPSPATPNKQTAI